MRIDALKQEQEFARKIKKNKKENLEFRHQCQMNMFYVKENNTYLMLILTNKSN